jgi:RES domain-containing protein
VWGGEGARLHGGRWNPPGLPAIYAGTSFAIAALEILVHANLGRVPRSARFVEAAVPDGVPVERLDPDALPGWADADPAAAQGFGGAWLRERRSAVLLVPSAATGGLDLNAVVNPDHPGAGQIAVAEERPVAWDRRLFGGG